MEIGDLTRIFCAAGSGTPAQTRFRLPSAVIFHKSVEGFDIDGGWLTVDRGRDLRDDPVRIQSFFTAQAEGLDIHPKALRAITRNLHVIDTIRDDAEANRLFVEMLTSEKDPDRPFAA